MKRTAIVLIFLILGFSVGGYAAYHYYDHHHVSSDLKRTLTAAMDSQNKESDITGYMHDARLQVRTKKDAELIGKMDQLLALAASAEKRYQDTMERIRNSGMQRPVIKLLDIERQYKAEHLPVPQDLKDHIDQQMKEWKVEIDQQKEDDEADSKRAKDEEVLSRRLVAEVRHDIGLPPLPSRER